MHEAQAQHALSRIDPHRSQRAHGVKVAAACHDAVMGQRRRDRLGRAVQRQGQRRRAILGAARANQAQVVAGRQMVQQRLGLCHLMPAHQVMDGGVAAAGICGGSGTEVMGVQRVDIVRNPGAGRDLRVIRAGGRVALV